MSFFWCVCVIQLNQILALSLLWVLVLEKYFRPLILHIRSGKKSPLVFDLNCTLCIVSIISFSCGFLKGEEGDSDLGTGIEKGFPLPSLLPELLFVLE